MWEKIAPANQPLWTYSTREPRLGFAPKGREEDPHRLEGWGVPQGKTAAGGREGRTEGHAPAGKWWAKSTAACRTAHAGEKAGTKERAGKSLPGTQDQRLFRDERTRDPFVGGYTPTDLLGELGVGGLGGGLIVGFKRSH